MTFPVVEHMVVPLLCTLQQLSMVASCGATVSRKSSRKVRRMKAMSLKTFCHLCGVREGILTDDQATFHHSAARKCAVIVCLHGCAEEKRQLERAVQNTSGLAAHSVDGVGRDSPQGFQHIEYCHSSFWQWHGMKAS